MRIEQLEYFLHVAQYGSLSLAASKIYVGQPTLSAAIASLEKELGKPLFRRTRRGMVLTPFGEDVLPLIEKTVDDYYDIRRRAGVNNPLNTNVHLASTFFTASILNEVLDNITNLYPSASFTILSRLSGDLLRDIADDIATIGIGTALDFNLSRHREYANSLGLRLLPLYNDNLCLFAKSGGRFQELEEQRLSQLPKGTLLSLPRDLVENGSIKAQSHWATLPAHLTFEDGESLWRYVHQTDTLGVTSMLATRGNPLFSSGLLRTVTLTDTPVNLVHYLTYPKNRTFSEAEADFIQRIENHYERLDD